ncbi:uncharacterized protein LOC123674539 [Harmonia axyridis]|uniref:uncharacterized protein LOC123674539 n=1 Tax=Harmonia axyridis TaxID=115357 RepID=UPI001E27524D|nr:uncharacterized protein LOC123674539 [Harmonia axyridis]
MRIFLSIFLVYICSASELKCPTCFRDVGRECKFIQEISCSEQTVKAISAFCPGFDDRAMWGLPFICLDVYDQNTDYIHRFQGCFHRFNDHLDMCSVLKQACPHDFTCKNGTINSQGTHNQKQGRDERDVDLFELTNNERSIMENHLKTRKWHPYNTDSGKPTPSQSRSYDTRNDNTTRTYYNVSSGASTITSTTTTSPWQNIANFIHNFSHSNVTINNYN